jgi:hypothetical protein
MILTGETPKYWDKTLCLEKCLNPMHEGVSKIFRTGAAVVVVRSTGRC